MEIEHMETVLPGVITSVDGDTVTCRTCIRKISTNGVLDVRNIPIPGIPLMKLGGSYAEISFPAKVGDHVLLVAFSRDSSKWKKEGKDDIIPESATGLTLNDFVAVPFVRRAEKGAARIEVSKDGTVTINGHLTIKS